MSLLPRPTEYRLMTAGKYWEDSVSRLSEQEKAIIHDKITNVIKYDPYDSESLVGPLQGFYSYNRIASGNRIVFAICYECRRRGFTKVNNCADCKSVGNDVVMLFVAGPHSIYDSFERERQKRLRFRQ
jgi:hypothetical protein